MKIIYRARDLSEAHIVAGLLHAGHIKAHVGGHYLQGGIGDLPASELAVVYVADEDIERAQQIIDRYTSTQQNAPTENPARLTALSIAVIVLSVLLILFFAVTYGN